MQDGIRMALQVLIGDADPSASMVMRAMVQRSIPGAIAMCESTPDRGRLPLQQTTPDTVIIDPATPGLGSTLLMQRCKYDLPTTRIVVPASAPIPAPRAVVQALGIDVYLEKPIPRTTLMEKLQALPASGEDGARSPSLPPMQHPESGTRHTTRTRMDALDRTESRCV